MKFDGNFSASVRPPSRRRETSVLAQPHREILKLAEHGAQPVSGYNCSPEDYGRPELPWREAAIILAVVVALGTGDAKSLSRWQTVDP